MIVLKKMNRMGRSFREVQIFGGAMRKISLIIICLFLWSPLLTWSQEPDGRKIFEEHMDRHHVKSVQDHVVMLLIDKKGNRKIRSLKRYGKEFKDGLKRSLIVFLTPADLKSTALLTWQLSEGEYKQWLYLPGREALQRIAAQSRRSAFMGSDFTYEDLQPDVLDNFNFSPPEIETIEDQECFVIDITPATPKIKKRTSYGKRRVWIRKDIYFTIKIEFFDHHNRLIKTQTNHELTHTGNDIWYAGKVIMENYKKKHKTLMGVKKREANIDINDSLFTQKIILNGMHVK